MHNLPQAHLLRDARSLLWANECIPDHQKCFGAELCLTIVCCSVATDPQVQDTVAVCASQLSQHIALAALQQGDSYLQEQLAGLETNQAFIEDALSPLGSAGHGWVGGEGAIYYWAKLPAAPTQATTAAAGGGMSESDAAAAAALSAGDEAVVEWLIQEHGVCIIPGSACGAPGYVRVAFANLKPDQCQVAAGRLKAGLQQLARIAGAAAAATKYTLA